MKPAEATIGARGSGNSFRIEKDPLGERKVPADALYGIQTLRARENFKISSLRIDPLFYLAYAEIKRAAAETNVELGKLDPNKGDAIIAAADEVIAGKHANEFDLDVFQAGAGTSYNMNLNEVIANRALEIMGRQRGDHEEINPNDDVNKSQSTNDTMPTAVRITTVRLLRKACEALDNLAAAFDAKGLEFAKVKKSGRTHLHDAVPMTLGDEFAAYAVNLRRATDRLRAQEAALLEVPLGGTAVGTGTGADRRYAALAVRRLAKLTGLKLKSAKNKVASQQGIGDFVAVSSSLRCICAELQKIANDLRLMNSGPHTALFEIELPATQPGSSIMPGKVNPGMAEMVNIVCFHITGHDHAISACGEAGQLELNVMMPYAAYALFESLSLMANAAETFDRSCVRGVKANTARLDNYLKRSVGQAALLNDELGFMEAARVAERAIEEEKTVREIAEEEGISTKKLV